MDVEGKGFVIKDKRSFDDTGDLKKEPSAEEEPQKKDEEKPGETKKRDESPPLPEVNFNSLIFSISSSALLHLGEIADPQTGEKKKDIAIAKHSIDTIAMLKEKTRGNLTEEEQKFLDSVLTDLRWRFVKVKE